MQLLNVTTVVVMYFQTNWLLQALDGFKMPKHKQHINIFTAPLSGLTVGNSLGITLIYNGLCE